MKLFRPAPEPAPSTNQALRQYVTRVSFDMSLSNNQIETLVYLDLMRHCEESDRSLYAQSREAPYGHPIAHEGRYFVAGANKLKQKGLVEHEYREDQKATQTWNEIWRFTRAGDLVVELLKEAGLYAEVAARMPRIEKSA
jgi:hypothetical protein